MIKMIENMDAEKQKHNVGVKAGAYGVAGALIREGWELIELAPYKKNGGRQDKKWIIWLAVMVKDGVALSFEVSGQDWGLIGCEFQCPLCGHKTMEDYCENCRNEIEPILMKIIPDDFKGGDGDASKTFNR